MTLRRIQEQREIATLSERATLSVASRGRRVPEEECSVRTCFQRDRDRIIHSKAFRRLIHKTQVFIAPEGDHYRTRLTHTLEVAQISRTVARGLRLNEDLTEAIALGHDLGHTPFGHTGEKVLDELSSSGFKHNEQSLRVVDVLEEKSPDVPGLNLTYEVRDGILCHTGPRKAATLEGQVVAICDRVAYINHDIDDALRAGIIKFEDLPEDCLEVLGYSHSQRIDTMVRDLIATSENSAEISMSDTVREATERLREFLFHNVYVGSEAKSEEIKVRRAIRLLYEFYKEHPEEVPGAKEKFRQDDRFIIDYIAGMTDRFAIWQLSRLFVPEAWKRR